MIKLKSYNFIRVRVNQIFYEKYFSNMKGVVYVKKKSVDDIDYKFFSCFSFVALSFSRLDRKDRNFTVIAIIILVKSMSQIERTILIGTITITRNLLSRSAGVFFGQENFSVIKRRILYILLLRDWENIWLHSERMLMFGIYLLFFMIHIELIISVQNKVSVCQI